MSISLIEVETNSFILKGKHIDKNQIAIEVKNSFGLVFNKIATTQIEIFPNEKVLLTFIGEYLNEDKTETVEISLKNLVATKHLVQFLVNNREYSFIASDIIEDIYTDTPYLNEISLEYLANESDEVVIIPYLLYPNMLNLEFIFNFLDELKNDEGLSLITSVSPKKKDLLRIIFPVSSKKTMQLFQRMLILDETKYENLSSVHYRFPKYILDYFQNIDKLNYFINYMYEGLDSINHFDSNYMSFPYGQWENLIKEKKGILNHLLMYYVTKREHAIEDFFISSLDNVLNEVLTVYEEADMGDYYDILNGGHFNPLYTIHYHLEEIIKLEKSIRLLLDNKDDKKATKLLYDYYYYFMNRSTAKNIQSLHNLLSELHLKLSKMLGKITTFNYSPEIKKLEEKIDETYQFILPENDMYLNYIGETMNHCVGSYKSIIESSLSGKDNIYIVSLNKENIPILCLEISGKEIVQAKKYFNGRLSFDKDKDIIKIVKKYIQSKNLIINTVDLIALKNK